MKTRRYYLFCDLENGEASATTALRKLHEDCNGSDLLEADLLKDLHEEITIVYAAVVARISDPRQ